MPLKKLTNEQMNEKLHLREEVRQIVAEKGLTDILRIDPQFMMKADSISEEELSKVLKSKRKWSVNAAKERYMRAVGSMAGASYLATNAANVGQASNLAHGYFAGGLFGFMNSVPDVMEQGKKTAENWDKASKRERYKIVRNMGGGVNGLAGNTRNVVIQSADGFAGVTWNTPGMTYTESGVNPAQLEADIAFNIVNNSLVIMRGEEQISESNGRRKAVGDTTASIREQQVEAVEGIKTAIDDKRIEEIITSLKAPKAKAGKFIPSLTKLAGVIEELHEDALVKGESKEKLERFVEAKKFLEDNMASFEETEKLVRANAMAMKQANFERICGTYDVVKGSVCTAAITTRFISSPMGGIAGLVDGLTAVLGEAALKGKFFGLEELWDNKSIIGQHNRRKAAAREVDAAICLCGDRDYNMKSATRQLVQDVIKTYNERNSGKPLPVSGGTKRSIAAKVYFELGSSERSKAGLGNNAMLIRAAELRNAVLQEPSKDGPYHWCMNSLGLSSTCDRLPSVDQIAQKMGCNRSWLDLIKKEEIDKKEKMWVSKQAQREEGSDEKGTARNLQAKEQIVQAVRRLTSKRMSGRNLFMHRVQLEAEDESLNKKKSDLKKTPKETIGQEGIKTEGQKAVDKPVKKFSKAELEEMGLLTGHGYGLVRHRESKAPVHESGEMSRTLSKDPLSAGQIVKKRQMLR